MANFKTNAMRILDTAKIKYSVHTYESNGDFDGTHVAAKLGIDENRVFKTLITKGTGRDYFVFVIPVVCELDLKAAARAVGDKAVEMIAVKDINKVSGYIRGGCSPIGMKKQFVTVIDEKSLNFGTIVFSAGKIGYQVEVNPKDLINLISAKTENITRGE